MRKDRFFCLEAEDSVIWFHIFQRLTARMILVLLAFFFWTMCRVVHNWIAETFHLFDSANSALVFHKILGKYWFTFFFILHVTTPFLPLIHRDLHITDETLYPFYIPVCPREV